MAVQISGNDITVPRDGTFSRNVSIAGTLTYEDVTNVDSIGLVTARNGIEVGASPGVAASISVDGNMIVSGITTIGGVINASSDIKVGSGVTVGKDGDIFATGVCTATSFAGDGSALTGIGGTDFIHSEQINNSGIVTAAAFIPTTGQLSHRNIVINGAMTVAQRGTSSTSQGFQTVDRFAAWFGGTDEAPTQSTFEVTAPSSPYHLPTSGAHPYKEGFRQAFGVTNGNQTGGAGASDYVMLRYKVEARDIANSGWDYTSTSSYITLSFWVKSSVSQNFYGRLETADGTGQNYPFETGSLTAFTWTKITKTIPGNANLTFNNDNGNGLEIHWEMFRGTDFTDNSVSNDTWAAYASGTRTKDATSTWYTTNDASFQITGVQLEVGSAATPFEHRSFGDELIRCQRYCFTLGGSVGGNAEVGTTLAMGVQSHSTTCKTHIQHPVIMRDEDITFTFADLTVDDDVSSYAAHRVESVLEVKSSATSSSLLFTTDTMGTVNPTRVLVDSAGGYIRGECEM